MNNQPILATLQGMTEHEDEFLGSIGIKREPFNPVEVMKRMALMQKNWDEFDETVRKAVELPDDDPRRKELELDAKEKLRRTSDALRSVVSMLGIKLLFRMLDQRGSLEVTQIILELLVGEEYTVTRHTSNSNQTEMDD